MKELRYAARFHQDGDWFLAEFPDLGGGGGTVTEGRSREELAEMAQDIVDTYVAMCLEEDEDPMEPQDRLPKGAGWKWVYPAPKVALAWQIRRLRRSKGLTQRQVADAMKITQETFTRWENPRTLNPTVATVEKVAKALGARVKIELEPVG